MWIQAATTPGDLMRSLSPRLILSLLGGRHGGRSRLPASARSRYAVHSEDALVRHITARGALPGSIQTVLDGIRYLPGPLGLVLVEVGPPPREWVASSLPQARVLEALMALRDVWGQGHVDLAVHSRRHGVEIFLDRYGTLEFRMESWLEPRIRSLLERRGFQKVTRLSVLPASAPTPIEWTEGHADRLRGVRSGLAMRPAAPRSLRLG